MAHPSVDPPPTSRDAALLNGTGAGGVHQYHTDNRADGAVRVQPASDSVPGTKRF